MGDVDFILDMPTAAAMGELQRVERGIEGINQKFSSTGGDLSEQMGLGKAIADLERVKSGLGEVHRMGTSFAALTSPLRPLGGPTSFAEVSRAGVMPPMVVEQARTPALPAAAANVGATSFAALTAGLTVEERGIAVDAGREAGKGIDRKLTLFEQTLLKATGEVAKTRTGGPATSFSALMLAPGGGGVSAQQAAAGKQFGHDLDKYLAGSMAGLTGQWRVGGIAPTGTGEAKDVNAFREQIGVATSGLGGLTTTLFRTVAAGAALIGIPVAVGALMRQIQGREERGAEAVSRREQAQMPLGAMSPAKAGAVTKEAREELAQLGIAAENVVGMTTEAQALYGEDTKKFREALRVMGQMKQVGIPEGMAIQLMRNAKQQGMTPTQMGALVTQERAYTGMTAAEYAAAAVGATTFKSPYVAAGVLRALKAQPGEQEVYQEQQLGQVREDLGRVLSQEDTKFAKAMEGKIARWNKVTGEAWDWSAMNEMEKLGAVKNLIGPEEIQIKSKQRLGISKEEARSLYQVIRPGHFEAVEGSVAGTEGIKTDLLGEAFEQMKSSNPELRRAISVERAKAETREKSLTSPTAKRWQREQADLQLQAQYALKHWTEFPKDLFLNEEGQFNAGGKMIMFADRYLAKGADWILDKVTGRKNTYETRAEQRRERLGREFRMEYAGEKPVTRELGQGYSVEVRPGESEERVQARITKGMAPGEARELPAAEAIPVAEASYAGRWRSKRERDRWREDEERTAARAARSAARVTGDERAAAEGAGPAGDMGAVASERPAIPQTASVEDTGAQKELTGATKDLTEATRGLTRIIAAQRGGAPAPGVSSGAGRYQAAPLRPRNAHN